MAKESNIVHRYFKKKFDGATILVKVNPLQFKGVEITLGTNGASEMVVNVPAAKELLPCSLVATSLR